MQSDKTLAFLAKCYKKMNFFSLNRGEKILFTGNVTDKSWAELVLMAKVFGANIHLHLDNPKDTSKTVFA